jgi:hypothetical protein
VNAVLECAGIDNKNINSGTGLIFTGAERVDPATITDTSINGKALKVGDLIGWTEGDDKKLHPNDGKKGNGHVVIYVGDGTVNTYGLFNESHGGKTNGVLHASGAAFGSFPVTKYKSHITYIRRLSTI